MSTKAGRLVRLGFRQAERSGAALARIGPAADGLLEPLAGTADPDQAVDYLDRLVEVAPDGLLEALTDDPAAAARLLAVLGASQALGDHLLRHPEQWRELADPMLGSTRPAAYAAARRAARAVGADPERRATRWPTLRRTSRRSTRCGWSTAGCCCGWPPATSPTSSASTTSAAELVRPRRRHARGRARRRPGAGSADADDRAGSRSIAMGKCGGHELNYVTDVDVVFVAEPADGADEHAALRAATQLAADLMQICSEHTAEGTIWPVDANLRPEGKAGPLVRTLASHRGLLRAVGQDLGVPGAAQGAAGRRRPRRSGRQYVELVAPMVWQAARAGRLRRATCRRCAAG